MAQLSRTDYILSVTAGAVPLVDDEEPEEVSHLILCFHIKILTVVFQMVDEAPAEPEREPPARVWHPDMHVSTSGPRDSRRGQKKAAKAKAKAKKRSG